jgi:hypothetical protein
MEGMMAAMLDHLRYFLNRLGRSGLAGLLLLAASSVLWLTLVQPKQQHLQELTAENQRLVRRIAARHSTDESRLAHARSLPNLAPEAESALGRLYAAADKSGLILMQGQYRMTEIRDARLSRYQLTLPVMGSYSEIRSFMTHALNSDPALALNGFRLSRGSIELINLEGTLYLTLFVGAKT